MFLSKYWLSTWLSSLFKITHTSEIAVWHTQHKEKCILNVFWILYILYFWEEYSEHSDSVDSSCSKKAVEGVSELCKFHVKDSSMKDPLKVVINAKEPLVILLRKESQQILNRTFSEIALERLGSRMCNRNSYDEIQSSVAIKIVSILQVNWPWFLDKLQYDCWHWKFIQCIHWHLSKASMPRPRFRKKAAVFQAASLHIEENAYRSFRMHLHIRVAALTNQSSNSEKTCILIICFNTFLPGNGDRTKATMRTPPVIAFWFFVASLTWTTNIS